ncbi:MAG: uncharacterized protein JWM53_1406 [bacterium]|nr:uncharacterized protein [bacterium]
MKYRLLAVVPLVALALFWIALAVVPEAQRAAVYRVDVELAKSAALVGCAAAALRFGRGDYLRTAWLLLAQCYLLILCNDVLFRAGLGVLSDRPWAVLAGNLIIFLANAGQLVGTVMIARVWRVAGFELAGSPLVRRSLQVGAIAIALVAAGWLCISSARDVLHGQTAALVDLFSSVADIISFALIAPFLLTAIAFRGGTLGWTWGLLTISSLGWLLFDATLSFGPWLVDGQDAVLKVSESARLLACTFGMSAGLAQRMAVRSSATASVAVATAGADAQG